MSVLVVPGRQNIPRQGSVLMSTQPSPLIIPFDHLSSAALDGIISEFVTRNGTELGREIPLEEKIQRVRTLLMDGTFVLVFDEESETCSVVPASAVPKLRL